MNEEQEFRLTALLQEDGATTEEIAIILPLIHQIAHADRPKPSPAETNALLATLLPEMPASGVSTAVSETRLWLLLSSQVRVVRREIWAASALIMALGVFVSLFWRHEGGVIDLPLVLIAPVVAALGIAMLYGSAGDVWELELATAVPARLLLLARLLLVFGCDLLLAMVGSLILAFWLPDVALWSLVTTWLAPMTFLTALAFLITVLSGSAEIGMIASLSVWAVQVVRLKSDDLGPFAIYWPDLLATASHPVLWGLTLLLAAVALWLGGQEEHWIKGIRR